MLTFTKAVTTTETTTLETPADIADYVHAEFLRRTEAAPFKFGDRVRITRRRLDSLCDPWELVLQFVELSGLSFTLLDEHISLEGRINFEGDPHRTVQKILVIRGSNFRE